MDIISIIITVLLNTLINKIVLPRIRYLLIIILKKMRSNLNNSSVNHPNTPFTYNGKIFVAHS